MAASKRVAHKNNDTPSATPNRDRNMVRIIFNVRGTDHLHEIPRHLLVTSKYITDNCHGQAAGRMPELCLTFNLRDVGHMWHCWVLNRQVVLKYFLLCQYEQANKFSAERREYEFYLELLACLCLSHHLGNDTFEEAVRTTIISKLRIGSDQAVLIACLSEKVVSDLFSRFDKNSSVRAIIANATVQFGTIGDLRELQQRNDYPRDYVTAVAAHTFEEMLRFKFGDQATESSRLFIAPIVEKQGPATWEILTSRLKHRITGDINACHK